MKLVDDAPISRYALKSDRNLLGPIRSDSQGECFFPPSKALTVSTEHAGRGKPRHIEDCAVTFSATDIAGVFSKGAKIRHSSLLNCSLPDFRQRRGCLRGFQTKRRSRRKEIPTRPWKFLFANRRSSSLRLSRKATSA